MRASFLSMLLLASCSTPGPAAPSDAGGIDATESDAAPSDASYGPSACGQCVAAACSGVLATCAAEPDCAAYLSCVDACPLLPSGDIDPACAASCPPATSSAGASALQQFERCRTEGAGVLCPTCTTDAGEQLNPLLRNVCPPSDAGDPCTGCIDQHCCQTNAACDPQCIGFTRCMQDGGAYLDCNAQFPNGRTTAESRQACHEIFCARANLCPEFLDPCLQCIFQECAVEYANFRGSTAGSIALECIAAPDGSAAVCLAMYPDAGPIVTAYETCVHENCPPCSAM